MKFRALHLSGVATATGLEWRVTPTNLNYGLRTTNHQLRNCDHQSTPASLNTVSMFFRSFAGNGWSGCRGYPGRSPVSSAAALTPGTRRASTAVERRESWDWRRAGGPRERRGGRG